MPIVRATLWRHDKDGTPHCETMPQNRIKTVLKQLSRYWTDPYTNIGFLKAVNRNKSHPGAYSRRRLAEEGDDD